MAYPGSSETDLVLALQRVPIDGGWADFLGRLARTTGAKFAICAHRSAAGGSDEVAWEMVGSGDPPVDRELLRRILPDHLRNERIYTTAELAELAGSGETFAAMLTAAGTPAMRAIQVPFGDGLSMRLAILGAGEFEAADGALLRRLYPFLQAAARGAARLDAERLAARIEARLARRATPGWLLLDRAGMVLARNVAQLPDGLRIVAAPQGSRLMLTGKPTEPTVVQHLEQLALRADGGAQVIRLGDEPLCFLELTPFRQPFAASIGAATALATLHVERRAAAGSDRRLATLYGLSPNEARLAVAIADGGSLADSAAALGLTIETARNYSKKIFAKTRTRGQVDLVRRILAGGLALPAPNDGRADGETAT